MINRSVVTIAVGKPYYLNLAENLLRSFLLWNQENDIHFLLLTDNTAYFKTFTNIPKLHIKDLAVTESERSFTSKFLLFDHAISAENLFIDCDCLIYGDLSQVFNKMDTQDFTVIGHDSNDGSFFCDVSEMVKKFNLACMPKFVGSVYFFKKNEIAGKIFAFAKTLKSDYDKLGFIRLRNKENEEPLLAVAMAVNHQQTIADDGSIKADAMFFARIKTNMSKGKARLFTDGDLKNPEYSTITESRPLIVHFNDRYSELAGYKAEEYRLRHTGSNYIINQLIVQLRYLLPELITDGLKNIFRPLYHRMKGPSAIKQNRRVL